MKWDPRSPVIYLALGDSTGAGAGAKKGGGYAERLFSRIEVARPGSRFVNLCVSGATTEDVLRDQVGQVQAAAPTLITIGIGVNDVQRLMLEEYERNLESIVGRVRAGASAPIVAVNIPDIAAAPGVPEFVRDELRRRINSFNGAIARVARRLTFTVVDVYTRSHELLPLHPEYFSDDLFHPSDEGYQFWASEMWPAIEKAISDGRPPVERG
jgi:lysophospholipase L1-like esterase